MTDNQSQKKVATQLTHQLEEGGEPPISPEEEAVHQLSPRWEVRTKADQNPITEETKKIKQVVKKKQ